MTNPQTTLGRTANKIAMLIVHAHHPRNVPEEPKKIENIKDALLEFAAHIKDEAQYGG